MGKEGQDNENLMCKRILILMKCVCEKKDKVIKKTKFVLKDKVRIE